MHRPPRAARAARLPIAIAVALATLVPSAAAAQGARPAPAIHVDTVLLARDLDGSGRVDHVVLESRKDSPAEEFARWHRLALYLDAAPRAGRPAWATDWDEEWESLPAVASATALPGGGTLLQVDASQGDFYPTWLVIAEHGTARLDLEQGVDYLEGALVVRRLAGTVTVDATHPTLSLRGRPLVPAITCAASEWPAMRLVFDAATRRLVPQRALCMSKEAP